MNAIKAIWINGQIVPAEPVTWPEGSELRVEPIGAASWEGLNESNWSDDPASLEAWEKAVRALEPMTWLEGEREEYERYRQRMKEFNREAVAKQMAELSQRSGDQE